MTLGKQDQPHFHVLVAACLGFYFLASGPLSLTQALACTMIVDAEGFESPTYDTAFPVTPVGSLEGQGGWLATIGTTSTAIVQTTTVYTGSQAVRVDRASNTNDRWAVPVSGWPSERFVKIQWDMRVEGPAGDVNSGEYGPYFAVEAYDDDGFQAGSFGLMGSLGVDASTAEVLYQAAGTGYLTPTGSLVNFGEWNHFLINLDFVDHQYTVALNGNMLVTEDFVDGAGLNQFTDADIAALQAAGDAGSNALTGTAFYDNFTVCQVPEPGSALLAMLAVSGLSCLLGRTKRM